MWQGVLSVSRKASGWGRPHGSGRRGGSQPSRGMEREQAMRRSRCLQGQAERRGQQGGRPGWAGPLGLEHSETRAGRQLGCPGNDFAMGPVPGSSLTIPSWEGGVDSVPILWTRKWGPRSQVTASIA